MKLCKKIFYDYIPVLAVAAILPLLVYVHIYHYSSEQVAMLSESVELSDLFSYGKAVFFGILTCWMVWYLVSDVLVGKRQKKETINRIFLLLFALGVWQILSMFFAIDKKMALWGGYGRFEGTYVLIGYLVLCYYTYKITLKHGKNHWVCVGLSISSIIMAIPGILQVFATDPFLNEKILHFLPPFREEIEVQATLALPKAYMTLANPNTASMYIAMVLPFLFMCSLTLKGWQQKLAVIAVALDATLLVFTGSRVGLFSLALTLVTGVLLGRKMLKAHWKKTTVGLLVIVVLAVGANFAMKLTTMSLGERMAASKINGTTKDVLHCETREDGIYLMKESREYRLSFDADDDFYMTLKVYNEQGKDVTSSDFSFENGTFKNKAFEGITVEAVQVDEEDFLMIQEEQQWFFTHDVNGGYLLYVGNGCYDTIENAQKITLPVSDSFASGRGYIWSRSLPLLTKYGLFGCGADNFVLAFPQADYNAKREYCKSYLTTIEKPHNGYLQLAIQNGIPALVFVILFYIAYVCQMTKRKFENPLLLGAFLGTVSYVFAMLFNDSNVMVTTLFFVFVGMTMAGAERS